MTPDPASSAASPATPSAAPLAPPRPSAAGRRLLPIVLGVAGLVMLFGAVMLFVTRQPATAEGLVFEIPAGTAQTIAQPTIDSAIVIPTSIVFAAGETAVITVVNRDNVAHRAGPFLVGPNQTFVQRFPNPGVYPIACAVDPAESVIVEVAG